MSEIKLGLVLTLFGFTPLIDYYDVLDCNKNTANPYIDLWCAPIKIAMEDVSALIVY